VVCSGRRRDGGGGSVVRASEMDEAEQARRAGQGTQHDSYKGDSWLGLLATD